MMIEAATALALLQWGDSAFPAGGFAFSWGVEGLAADGLLNGVEDLDEVVENHLTHRWNTMDRILLRRAFVAPDLEAVAAIDRLAEAATPGADMRNGSRRAGRALLGTSARLGHAPSAGYRQRLGADARLGHLCVMQGLVYAEAGLTLDASELLSGWTLVAGLVSAAVRLGCVGHIEAQHVLARGRRRLAEHQARAPDPSCEPHGFTPLIDIAVARGAGRHLRLFAT